MPALLNTYINNTLSRYNSWFSLWDDVYNNIGSAGTNLQTAGTQLGNAALTAAGTNLLSAQSFMQQQLQYTLSWNGTSEYWIIKALQWINTNWPAGAGALAMGDILTAMLAATFAELTSFIGIVEAYHVAVWNAPFNADYYAALARGFQKWPEP